MDTRCRQRKPCFRCLHTRRPSRLAVGYGGAASCKVGFIPFLNHPCTVSASLAVRLYCLRFAFAFTNVLEMELHVRANALSG